MRSQTFSQLFFVSPACKHGIVSTISLFNVFCMYGYVAVLPPLVCGGEGVWCLTDSMLASMFIAILLYLPYFSLIGHEQTFASE
jgi:hypothetical protein